MSASPSPDVASHPVAAPPTSVGDAAARAVGAAFLADALAGLRELKKLADDAVAQVDDAALAATIDDESNSIAVLMRHVAGNMRSRFTDFLDSDGEKPDRDRDGEFATSDADVDRARLHAEWDAAWARGLATIGGLGPDDLLREVRLRGQPLTVLVAVQRAMRHYAQHVGQIVLLAKHHAGPAWRTLSIPKKR